jgi:broad specificity phosphatase PhoE
VPAGVADSISLTLLRDGRSQADDDQIFEGRHDAPLTEVQRRRAGKRANAWKDEQRALILSSAVL